MRFALAPLELGGGHVAAASDQSAVLQIPAKPQGYANAQLDDHRRLPRGKFPWTNGARMRLRARAGSSQPQGTLGFGFWNDPFNLSFGQAGAARKLPASPQALWFFYASEPNDIAVVPGRRGWGWKAQCLRGPIVSPVLLAGPAFVAVLLSRIRALRRLVMSSAFRRVTYHEALLDTDVGQWHDYEISWDHQRAHFRVDDAVVLEVPSVPRGPLGFVTWIDNQYAIASVEGGLHFGVIPTLEPQVLEVESIDLVRLGG